MVHDAANDKCVPINAMTTVHLFAGVGPLTLQRFFCKLVIVALLMASTLFFRSNSRYAG